IVGSKVKINALAAILGVFVSGSLAGITGMFLALPMIAVLKIIFDRSDSLKQWGVLLGDDNPSKSPMSLPRLRSLGKKGPLKQVQNKSADKPEKEVKPLKKK